MHTELFRTIGTMQILIGILGKSLGMQPDRELPLNHNNQRKSQQPPGKDSRDKKQWRKHHRIIPVIYSAAAAASVFKEPCLKRAKEQDTDHVAYSV